MKNTVNIGGRICRVEFNWNALADYCELSGLEDISKLDNLSAITATDMRTFIFCALKEGERMAGRDLELSPVDVGALLRPADISEIMQIYASQTKCSIDNGHTEAHNDNPPAKKKNLLRWKRSKG